MRDRLREVNSFFLVKPFFFSFTWEQMLYDTFTSPHLILPYILIFPEVPTYPPTYVPTHS